MFKPNAGQEGSDSEEGGKVRRRGSKHVKGDEEYGAIPDRPVTPDEVIEEREKEWQVIMKKRKEKVKRRTERLLAAPMDPDGKL